MISIHSRVNIYFLNISINFNLLCLIIFFFFYYFNDQIREAQRIQQETAFRIQAEQQQNAIAQQLLQQQPYLQESQVWN